MISNGIDLVKVDRFDKLKSNNSFMNSIFTEEEIEYIKFRNNDSSTIAGMFAAKEAFLKALKKGIDYCPFKDIKISRDSDNIPFIIFNNNQDINNISLSISHDGEYAIAIVSIIT